jgi:hypothetical protein
MLNLRTPPKFGQVHMYASAQRPLFGTHEREPKWPSGRERPGPYCAVAALNLATSSAGTRPRSFTSMPCALAHSRTLVLSTPSAALRPPWAGRRVPSPARRAACT